MDVESKPPDRKGTIFSFLFWLVFILSIVSYFELTANSRFEAENAVRYHATLGQIETLKPAIMAFHKRTARWPSQSDGVIVLAKPFQDPFTGLLKSHVDQKALRDVWGSDIQYRFPAKMSREPYDLWSLGPDARSGTDDDIGNWHEPMTAKR
jgi:hypothetical protein